MANIDLQIASNLVGGFRVEECLQVAERCVELRRRGRLGSMLPIAQVVAASAQGSPAAAPRWNDSWPRRWRGMSTTRSGQSCGGGAGASSHSSTRTTPRRSWSSTPPWTSSRRCRTYAAALTRPVGSAAHGARSGRGAGQAAAWRRTPVGAHTMEAFLDFAEAVAVAKGRDADTATASASASAADRRLLPVAD